MQKTIIFACTPYWYQFLSNKEQPEHSSFKLFTHKDNSNPYERFHIQHVWIFFSHGQAAIWICNPSLFWALFQKMWKTFLTRIYNCSAYISIAHQNEHYSGFTNDFILILCLRQAILLCYHCKIVHKRPRTLPNGLSFR